MHMILKSMHNMKSWKRLQMPSGGVMYARGGKIDL